MRSNMEKVNQDVKKMYFHKRLKENLFGWGLLFYPVLTFLIFYVGVNANSILLAFKTITVNGTYWAGFSNFTTFFSEMFNQSTLLGTAFVNSAKVYFINFAICNPLYFIFSFYIFKGFPGSKTIRFFMMIPMIVSGFILGLVFKMLVENGLPNILAWITGKDASSFPNFLQDPRYSFGTMIFYMIWTSFSMALILYPNAMGAIDEGIFESGRIDGAGLFKEFWYIVLPLIFPTFSTNIILGVADFFLNSGTGILFYMYDAPPEVQTVGYFFTAQVMKANGEAGYPYLAAGGLILTAITCPVVFLVKYLLEKFGPSEN